MILSNDITSIVYQGEEGKATKHFTQKDMSGTIVSSNASLLLVLAGLYMLEQGIAKQEMAVY